MSLLIDLFGYLSVIVHGLVIVAQSMALGGVLFLVLLARPLAGSLGPEGDPLARRIATAAAWSAVGLVVAEAAYLAMQIAVIVGTVELGIGGVLGAGFAVAGLTKCAAALLIAGLLFSRGPEAPPAALVALGTVALVAATLTTHGAARLEHRGPLLALEFLHQFGAALWIGGIPVFVLALAKLGDGSAWRRAGARFSRMSMVGVAAILLSGVGMSFFYIGDLAGFYGTAFGVMVGAKTAMLGMLLLLGLGNFLLVERLRHAPVTPITRMRRFAEAEIGIGFTIFFAAASLTSVPPAVDLTNDRVSWAEITERNTPAMPRLTSPDHDKLAVIALQKELDAEAAAEGARPSRAIVPGSGELPPRNADDVAWSEYNHNWAGIFVVGIGFLALLARAGFRPARHWPLLFIGLGAFLVIRGDPEVWPVGDIGLVESLRDVETLQHRAFELLVFAFAFAEWRVQTRGIRQGLTPLIFPLMSALGGALLLTHQHAISNVKDQLLIELSHTPLALAAVACGWSRWLELRLGPEDGLLRRVASWTWPVCLVVVGLILLLYRET